MNVNSASFNILAYLITPVLIFMHWQTEWPVVIVLIGIMITALIAAYSVLLGSLIFNAIDANLASKIADSYSDYSYFRIIVSAIYQLGTLTYLFFVNLDWLAYYALIPMVMAWVWLLVTKTFYLERIRCRKIGSRVPASPSNEHI